MRIAKPRSKSTKTYAEVKPKAKPDSFPQGEISSVMSTFWGKITAYNPDELVTKKGLTIYRKMANDEQVKAALASKIFAVLSSGYEIQAPELPEEEEEIGKELKDFVDWNFEEMEGHFDSKLAEMMTALTYGFACGEKVFYLIDFSKFDGKVGLKALKFRRPEGIDFEADQYGNLLDDGIIQAQRRLPKAKFLLYVYKKTFDNFYGESDLRAAYRGWWAKDVELKYMAIALERFGEPVADISHEGTITAAQKANLEAFIKNVQNRSGLIHDAKIKLDFKYPSPRTSEAYIPAINLHDTHIRIAILMPGLMGLSAEQVTGSLARSRTEFDTFLNIIGQLRKDVETTVNEQVIKELIDMNYEVTGGQYPTFKFKEVTQEHKERLFAMWLQAIGSGALKKFPEDEAKFRDVLELAPKEDEELVPEPQPGMEVQPGVEGFPQEGGFLFQASEFTEIYIPAPIDILDRLKIRRLEWDESKHPRQSEGQETGGQFAPGEGGFDVGTDGDVVFHGTPLKNVESIMREGIRGGKLGQWGTTFKQAFVAKDEKIAHVFGNAAARENKASEYVIIRARIPKGTSRNIDDLLAKDYKGAVGYKLDKIDPAWFVGATVYSASRGPFVKARKVREINLGEKKVSHSRGAFLFQDQWGHLYEQSFPDEAKLVEFVRGLKDAA